MARKGAIVSRVQPGSVGEEIGIERGDIIISINGRPINDILDYCYLADDNYLEVVLGKTSGEVWTLEIEKGYDESLGLEFEEVVFNRIKSCVNRCLFCFVDQLPPSMRKTLYLKDDDYRLSFIYGNYISLTNLNQQDWDKILGMRLSPLYISVHATDPYIRAKIFGSERARSLMHDLQRLKDHNIEVHTQVVLCPGVNDGDCLEQTIKDLSSFWPAVKSVGIVPVGITGFREELPKLTPVTREQAARLIDKVDEWQAKFRAKLGLGLVYLADEFYIKAGQDFPEPSYYDGYPQIENGIGLSTNFLAELQKALSQLDESCRPLGPVYVICGYSAVPMFKIVVSKLGKAGIELRIIPVTNNFFGGEVTVTGLLTGHDILQSLDHKYVGQRILLPEIMLRDGDATLLDDMTVSELAKKSGVDFDVIPTNPYALLEAILSGPSEEVAGGE